MTDIQTAIPPELSRKTNGVKPGDGAKSSLDWLVIPYSHEFKRHPTCGDFRDMTTDEFDQLVADIKANGLREPIVTAQHENNPAIVDGWHRYQACQKAKVNLKVRGHDAGKDGALEAFVDSLNLHRRHLTPEEKRARLEARIKSNPELSDRQHAAAVGVDNKTASSVRRKLEQREEIPHTATKTDTTGRSQPTTKAKPSKQPKPLKSLREAIRNHWPSITDDASQKEIFEALFSANDFTKMKKFVKPWGWILTKDETGE